jgi:hypothetical protein
MRGDLMQANYKKTIFKNGLLAEIERVRDEITVMIDAGVEDDLLPYWRGYQTALDDLLRAQIIPDYPL